MTISYTPTLPRSLDKVRFYIEDKYSGSGPLPDNANFDDDEITALITTEGSWQKAVAACYEALSSAWAGYTDISAGSRSENYSQISQRYTQLAQQWRTRYGTSQDGAGSRHPTRIDGYSSDVASGTV